MLHFTESGFTLQNRDSLYRIGIPRYSLGTHDGPVVELRHLIQSKIVRVKSSTVMLLWNTLPPVSGCSSLVGSIQGRTRYKFLQQYHDICSGIHACKLQLDTELEEDEHDAVVLTSLARTAKPTKTYQNVRSL